ncbi:MAG: OmpH family outer membrane protein [Crocinitomicaceae bacterium]|nr:MAG: OmpH family outer membrane protein [Crocinitomicaceae bacterium]
MKSIHAFTLLVAASLSFTACKGESKKEQNTVPNVPTVRANGLKIAFYNQDSLTKHFEYYVEMDSMMKSKQLRFQGELQKREKALQGYVMKNEELAKAGSLSAFEIQSIQEEAQRRQQALMQYQETEGMKLEKETGELLSVISKKIEQAGKKYSQKHGLDILMMHGAAGQFVYVNPTMDVTKEFIAYLNQHQSEIEADMGKTKK